MFVLAPLEAFSPDPALHRLLLFRQSANSRKLDTVIGKVATPDIHNVDVPSKSRSREEFAAKTVGETMSRFKSSNTRPTSPQAYVAKPSVPAPCFYIRFTSREVTEREVRFRSVRCSRIDAS